MVMDPAQWEKMAAAWELYGPPLRPSAADVQHYQDALNGLSGERPLGEALILGVTPELHDLDWPVGARVRAFDRSREMIRTVWPGDPGAVICGEWSESGLPGNSIDITLCDGGLHLLDYPRGQTALVAELARIVAPGGRVVFRLFLPPSLPETPEEVFVELVAGRIPCMNVLKLRLAHAMTPNAAEGVALAAIWQFLHERTGERDMFFDRLGWKRELVATIDFYRDSNAFYHFATLEEVVALFGADRSAPFRLIDLVRPDGPMGEQCAHLRLERI